MRNTTLTIRLACVLLAMVVCIMSLACAPTQSVAVAKDGEYSNVLDDLHKDTTFDASFYPEKADDYSLSITTIAESEDKELFVYVYQPSGQTKGIRASSINISFTAKEDITPSNYRLEYINSSGVFFKYKVSDITVSNAEARYYGIIQIMRPFDESLGDEQATGGNTIDEVPFRIAKEYRFFTINGKESCSVCDIETINITDKFVGFVRYSDGYIFHKEACDSHFVAFDTDRPIDHLMEADVEWTQQSCTNVPTKGFESTSFGDEDPPQRRTLSEDDETIVHHGDGWFAGTYEWKRIQTVDEFIAETDSFTNVYSGALLNVNIATPLTDEAKASLTGKKWVLRFVETKYEQQHREGLIHGIRYTYDVEKSTLVGDVIILRLKFKTDGVVYNLGVVDNKQSGSGDPVNKWDDPIVDVELNNNGKILLALLALLLLIILFALLIPTLIQGCCKLLCLPFKAVKTIRDKHTLNKTKHEGGKQDERQDFKSD